jgi:hypothetical protein
MATQPSGEPVPSLIKKLTTIARSPQSSTWVEKARQEAAKPENRRRLERLHARFVRKP